MEILKRRRFTKEFKEDVANLVKTSNKSVTEISKDLDISEVQIYRWYKKYYGATGSQDSDITEKEKELRELRAKLADVTEERDILKKAVSIFSKQGH